MAMKIKILGICGSPVKRGNTEIFLEEALKMAREVVGVDTELVTLAGKNIQDCIHCNWCLTKQEEGKFCGQKDDMSEIYPLLLGADGLLLASPAYFGRPSGRLSNLIDRLRVFAFGNYYRNGLKDKVGAGLAIAWTRHGGVETTLLTINYAFGAMGMLNVPEHGIFLGAAGVSSLGGTGKFTPDDKHLILKDEYGLRSAHKIVKRMVEIIRIVKLGKEALARESER